MKVPATFPLESKKLLFWLGAEELLSAPVELAGRFERLAGPLEPLAEPVAEPLDEPLAEPLVSLALSVAHWV